MKGTRRRPRRILTAILLLLTAACANTETPRIWRISPLSRPKTPAEQDGQEERSAARERINLWPLAYRDGDALSILWPLFDLDDEGFALRPLVSKEGSQWSILYPWSSIDTETGHGWALPYYRTEKSWGVFPLLHRGRFSFLGPFWWTEPHDQGRSYGLFPLAQRTRSLRHVGLLWWTPEWRSHGLLPLYSRGAIDQVGPAWWQRDRDGDGTLLRVGLFPLGYLDTDGDELLVVPFYYHRLGPASRERYYLLGLGHTHWEPKLEESWLLPFWYRHAAEERADTLLAPVFWRRERGDDHHVFTLLGDRGVGTDSSTLNVYPFWWSHRKGDWAMRMLLPAFYYERDGNDHSLVTPLGGRGWNTDGFTRYVNVLGPIYHSSRNVSGTRRLEAFLWPLVEYRRKDDEASLRVFPIFRHTRKPEATELWLLGGLGHGSSSAEGRSFRFWPFTARSSEPKRPDFLYDLTLYSRHSYGSRESSWLFPLYSTSRNGDDRSSSVFLGLGRWRTTPTLSQWEIFPLVARSVGGDRRLDYGHSLVASESWDRGSRLRILWTAAFSYEHVRHAGWEIPNGAHGGDIERWLWGALFESVFHEVRLRRRWIEDDLNREERTALEQWSSALDGIAKADQRDATRAREILAAHGVELPRVEPVGAEPRETQKAVEEFAQAHSEVRKHRRIEVPLIYTYERDGEDVKWNVLQWVAHSIRSADHDSLRILYAGYHRERRGDRISRDIFPFVVWDSAPDEVHVSFLWRLFRYQREGDRTGGHVLFIGWGDLELPPPSRSKPGENPDEEW